MKSVIRSFYSTDIDDIMGARPKFRVPGQSADDFWVPVRVMVGPLGGRGEESFDLMVCSASWLERELHKGPVNGRHYVFMRTWNGKLLEQHLRETFEVEGPDWKTIAARLARFGHWEFEDYKETST